MKALINQNIVGGLPLPIQINKYSSVLRSENIPEEKRSVMTRTLKNLQYRHKVHTEEINIEFSEMENLYA